MKLSTKSTGFPCSGILFGIFRIGETDMEQRNPINHILIADDDRDHALIFEKIIRREFPQMKVSNVTDGNQLMQFLRLNSVDLLFLDLKMPCKNGFECLQDIRRNPAFHHLPIVVYSSSAHLSDIQKSFLFEADFYLVKPFITEHLKRAIHTILSVDWKDNPPIRRHYFINNNFVLYTASA